MNKVFVILLIFGTAIANAQPHQVQFNFKDVTNLARQADFVLEGGGN